MTYIPPSPPASSAVTLHDIDTVTVVQAGAAKQTTLATLRSFFGAAASQPAAATNRIILRDGSLLVRRDGSYLNHR